MFPFSSRLSNQKEFYNVSLKILRIFETVKTVFVFRRNTKICFSTLETLGNVAQVTDLINLRVLDKQGSKLF